MLNKSQTMKYKKPSIPYENWKIESDNKCYPKDISKMALHLESEQKESYLNGNILAERMKDRGLSASVLDFLLENLKKIPESWKEKTKDGGIQFIFFWGTIYRHSRGDLYVRYLYWHDGEWQWSLVWLDFGFGSSEPSALASTLDSETKNSLETLSLDLPIFISELKTLIKKYE